MRRHGGKLPDFLKRYFWDVRFDGLDPIRFTAFILERILEYGDPQAVRWMQAHFEPHAIREAVRRSKNLSARSANFWATIYRLNSREVSCLSKNFQRKRRQHWFV